MSYLHLEWRSVQSLLADGGEFVARALNRVRPRILRVRAPAVAPL